MQIARGFLIVLTLPNVMKTSQMIKLTDDYRRAMLPVVITQSMLVADTWYDQGTILYIDKQKAKQLAEKGHAAKIEPREILPDWFFDPTEKDQDDDKTVRVQLQRPLNILGVDYDWGEIVFMDKLRADYLSKDGFIEVLPPLKREPEIEVAIIDTKVETTTIKTRRKRATKTDSSSSKSSRKRSGLKKSS